jgi:ubiquinone/menaquinone biosynthesis C-methylase UbiE
MNAKTEDVQRFDRWSETYEESFLQRLLFDRVHRIVLSLIQNQPDKILDVGCGTGRLLRKVGSAWPAAQLIGVDPAEGMVEQARQLTPGATFYVGPAEALPLPDSSVDLALSTISFHHWEDQAQGIQQITRVLRPGGRFILVDFEIPSYVTRVYLHGRPLQAAKVREMFANAGLTVRSQKHVMGNFLIATIGEKTTAG